jgi:hypothetical protein
MIEFILKILADCRDKLWDFAKQYYQKLRLWNFKRKEKRQSLKSSTARNIAQSILAGHIVAAIPYHNFNSKHTFIAVRRRDSLDAYRDRIHVLESVGNTFRPIWTSEILFNKEGLFEVIDCDEDGIKEIAFIDESFGTGGGSRTLFVYSFKRNQLYQISESYHWADTAGPASPYIEILPDTDQEFMEVLEDYAVKKGMLEIKAIDLDKPEFASQRWHSENGTKRTGPVKLHYYEGKPICGASITAEIEVGDMIWTAYFKGPLYGYIISQNKHFIAYSPAWFYNWAKCLVYYQDKLWFGIHVDIGLLSFKFDQYQGYLEYYTHFNNNELPWIEKILFYDDVIVLNDQLKGSISKLKKQME